jgi:hypothetical protein
MTIAQYDALPEREGVKYELNEGELLAVFPSPRLAHNRVCDEIGFRLREFVRSRRLGEVTMETDFKLTEGTIRIPDVAFVRPDPVVGIDPRQRLEGAPDLAVEVVSPRDDPDDLVLKRNSTSRRARGLSGLFTLKPASPTSTSPASVPRFVMPGSPSMMPNSFLVSLRHCPQSWDNEGTLGTSVERRPGASHLQPEFVSRSRLSS